MNTNKVVLKVELDYSFKSLLKNKISNLVAGAFLHNITIIHRSIALNHENINVISDQLITEAKKTNIIKFELLRDTTSSECTITMDNNGNLLSLAPLCDKINNDLRAHIKMTLDLCSYIQIIQLSTKSI